jgi:hypothetical protein
MELHPETDMANEKFKALVHYLVHECRDHPNILGAIRLNKALWYTDVVSYKANGVPVTGESYVKRKRGPVPAHILATLRELEAEGKIVIREPEYQYDVRKFISLVQPESEPLSDDERELARGILGTVCGFTANAISEMTHDNIWDAAAEGEEIPLYATLASDVGEISENVRSWAAGIAAEVELEAN